MNIVSLGQDIMKGQMMRLNWYEKLVLAHLCTSNLDGLVHVCVSVFLRVT